MKNLYLLTTNGLGDYYVLASDPTVAERALKEIFNKQNYGFIKQRHIINIKWLAEAIDNATEDCAYKLCSITDDTALLIVKNYEKEQILLQNTKEKLLKLNIMKTAKEFLVNKYKHLGEVNKLENDIVDLEFNELFKLMEEYANQSKWISVKDEKPRNLLNVLVCFEFLNETVTEKYITRGYYCGNDTWEVQNYDKSLVNVNVTHWQPLPEKP